MIVIAYKYLVPKGYSAIAVFPFIILHNDRYRDNETLINHEKIHLRQQAEMLVLFFFLWYFLEYMVRLIKYRKHEKAYRNISFEREAYAHQNNSNYLNNRTLWDFSKFL